MSDSYSNGRVRLAVTEDVERISELERVSFSEPWSENMIRSCLNADTDVFVLETDGGICGFAVFDRVLGDEAEILNIAIAPEARGNKLSHLLMDAMIAEAEKRNIGRIMLEVRISNAPAIALYSGYGFEKVGLRAGYYRNPREDALLMDLMMSKRGASAPAID
ncbi:MAG: ribosomal protein S18-alanine N-acetyltransferase [Clostridia bacterium]|nr:ribosomal protein S18-alanine N-acetyltransferase [Clostridia bacterium]